MPRLRSAWVAALTLLGLISTFPVRAGLLEDLVHAFGPGGRDLCIQAAPYSPHSVANCNSAYNAAEAAAEATDEAIEETVETAVEAVEEGVETGTEIVETGVDTAGDIYASAGECLADLAGCIESIGEEAVDALINAGDDAFVTLQGTVRNNAGQPLLGALVTAQPKYGSAAARAASTHIAVSGPNGGWRIDINRYLAHNGVYSIRANGPFHDFTPVEHTVFVGQ